MNTRKHYVCKICGRQHYGRGFCKSHLSAFYRGSIDANGIPKEGHYWDTNYHLKKKKNTLRIQIQESNWYREWRSRHLHRSKRTCEVCGDRYVKLNVHHDETNSFSKIINEAKVKYTDVKDQDKYIRDIHLYGNLKILVVCRMCHAKLHIKDKIYNCIAQIKESDICKVCGKKSYCKGFCHYHYGQYRVGVWDYSGKQLRILKQERKKGTCLVCKKESRGSSGDAEKFCPFHYSQFKYKIIDSQGKQIRSFRVCDPNKKCIVCGQKHYGKGFCLTHYNRFKIGQIDKDGKELRPLSVFVVKGYRKVV